LRPTSTTWRTQWARCGRPQPAGRARPTRSSGSERPKVGANEASRMQLSSTAVSRATASNARAFQKETPATLSDKKCTVWCEKKNERKHGRSPPRRDLYTVRSAATPMRQTTREPHVCECECIALSRRICYRGWCVLVSEPVCLNGEIALGPRVGHVVLRAA
jgi:hypothetical protein